MTLLSLFSLSLNRNAPTVSPTGGDQQRHPGNVAVCGVRLRGVHERARGAAPHLQAGERLTGLEKTWTIFSLGKLLLNKRVR